MSKTIAQKKADKTYRKDRDGEAQLETTELHQVPDPPERLNDYGCEEWNRICHELLITGQLSSIDLGALELLSDAFGKCLEINEKVIGEFVSWYDYLKTTTVRDDMLLRTYNNAIDYYFKNVGMFGVSPMARSKIKLQISESKEALDLNKFRPA
jgi:P27 family predicted phage terminase small subunit